jgi:hypothetical protein
LRSTGGRTVIHRRFALVLLALTVAGCRRAPGKADPHYERARGLYQKLYGAELDDAYGDPKMDNVVALLKQVDPDSADRGAAQSMLEGIEHGRAAYAAQKHDRDRLAAAAAAPLVMPNINPDKVLAASAPDAGPTSDSFGPGAAIADLNRTAGGCLVANEPFTERGTDKAGTIYRLASTPQCAQLLPGFVNQAVLVVDGNVYRRIAAAQVPPQPPRPPEPQTPPPAAPAAPPAPQPARAAPPPAPDTTAAAPEAPADAGP